MEALPTQIADFLNGLFLSKDASQDIIFFRLLFASGVALIAAFAINRTLTRFMPRLAEFLTNTAAGKTHGDALILVRRTETFLSVGAAITRVLVVILCLYIAWRLVNPTTAPLAIIGASTLFIVISAGTIGPLLRDVTNGVLMIIGRWYNVGDHIVVDPFVELSGVVEQITLRSTKLRTLNGEVVWIHNQHMQAVRVTPRGVRTISIDTFVEDLELGRKLIEKVLKTMPTGPAMIATPLKIAEEEELGGLWRITAVGQTAPGREWLIEDFAVKALKQADEELSKDEIITYGPIVRYTDPTAERQFERSMRAPNPRAKR
ncbi:MAG: mechanosensitive ion channel family protein [Candidatus Saccharimonadales bacterium]